MTWERLAKSLDRCDNAFSVGRAVAFAACELLEADRGAMFVRDDDGDLRLLTATGFAYEPLAEYLVIPADAELPVARAARDGRLFAVEHNRAYAAMYPELAVQRSLEGMQAEAGATLWCRA